MNHQPNSELPDPMLSVGDPSADIDKLHRQALEEIRERGESPQEILLAFDQVIKQLRDKHLPDEKAEAERSEHAAVTLSRKDIDLGKARYFDEAVMAGSPVPGEAAQGRPAELSDIFGRIELAGKIMARVSGWSMRDNSIKDGDMVLVDPRADIRHGDIVLAHVAGHGQVVKRLRLVNGGHPILESANPDFPDIVVGDPSDLRIHGKVLWRAGPI